MSNDEDPEVPAKARNERTSPDIDLNFTMAFQPIVDTGDNCALYAYEALVRGPRGESADSVMGLVPAAAAIAFDAACRTRAVEMAASLGMRCRLSLNVSATAICDRRYGLQATLRTARQVGWPIDALIFELTEHHPVLDMHKLARWTAAARNRKIKIAVDDFGAGYAGLNSLFLLHPEMVKLDMALVRNIDSDCRRQALVKGIVDACAVFDCSVVAEGVETGAEFMTLSALGISLMQGYLFARPGVACLPDVIRPMSSKSLTIEAAPAIWPSVTEIGSGALPVTNGFSAKGLVE